MLYASRFIRLNSPFMQGPEVLEIQEKLEDLGFYSGKPDGIFDLSSETALKEFQKAHGLKVDGIVGPSVWKELHASLTSMNKATGSFSDPKIHVHLDTRILTMSSDSTIKTYPVAIGKPSTPTPAGEWTIVAKAVNPGGPFGARWMRLSISWGDYGIHGTNNPNSIGKAVSHGCIRLYNEDVIELYDLVGIGTPVSITGKLRKLRNLRIGYKGEDVRDVQTLLNELGYYPYPLDGYYGKKTRLELIAFQKKEGLRADGIADPKTVKALQIAHDLAIDDTVP
jgi:L,D-transpeptidase ErfK/SrfK